MSPLICVAISQGQITCPCRVPGQVPTSLPTCPAALWTCRPAATVPWVVTIMLSPLPKACQHRTKWTWPRGSPWETTDLGQTWTCSQIKVGCCFLFITLFVAVPAEFSKSSWCSTGPMMHQQPPSQQYNMPPAGAGQHYQGQQNPMGMMGQVNQGNHVMGQRPMPPYRPPQQGKAVRVFVGVKAVNGSSSNKTTFLPTPFLHFLHFYCFRSVSRGLNV